MRAIDLTSYETLVIPRNQGELMRAMNSMAQQLGAARFAYTQLPEAYDLLKCGVYPRMLTNYPDHILAEANRESRSPFSYAVRALTFQKPVFFSDAITPEELYFWKLSISHGLPEGVVIPIKGTTDAVLVFIFDRPTSKDWVRTYYDSPMVKLGQMIHLAIIGNPSLCSPFVVPGLTPRVKQILRLKVWGYTNEKAAEQLGVKPDTVKKALRRFSDRMGGLSTTELVYHMTKLGML